jgi:hypothetical protein
MREAFRWPVAVGVAQPYISMIFARFFVTIFLLSFKIQFQNPL